MKKKLLLLLSVIAIISCFFVLTVSAEENTLTYYLVNETGDLSAQLEAEGKTVITPDKLYYSETGYLFGEDNANKKIIINFAENINYTPEKSNAEPKPSELSGIRLACAIDVTFDLCGYKWWMPKTKAYTGFIVEHNDAVLTVKSNYDGEAAKITSAYSGDNAFADGVDIYNGYVFVYFAGGSVTCENLSIASVEETFYQKDAYYVAGAEVNLTFKNCSINVQDGNYSSMRANVAKNTVPTYLTIEGGFYDGCSIECLSDSTISNAVIYGRDFYTDSWDARLSTTLIMKDTVLETNYQNDADALVLYATNCTFGGVIQVLGDSTGGSHAYLTDCTYNTFTFFKQEGMVSIKESADCVNPSVTTVYTTENQEGAVDEENVDPALGHSYGYTFAWEEGNKYAGVCTATGTCVRCEDSIDETINPLITKQGFSVPTFGETRAILLGFLLNYEAIERYEELSGATLNYGIAVAIKECIGEGNAPLDENGEAVTLEKGLVIKFNAAEYKDYSNILFKINLTEEHFATHVLMTGYMYETDENGTVIGDISYIQDKYVQPAEFGYTSYNIQNPSETAVTE